MLSLTSIPLFFRPFFPTGFLSFLNRRRYLSFCMCAYLDDPKSSLYPKRRDAVFPVHTPPRIRTTPPPPILVLSALCRRFFFPCSSATHLPTPPPLPAPTYRRGFVSISSPFEAASRSQRSLSRSDTAVRPAGFVYNPCYHAGTSVRQDCHARASTNHTLRHVILRTMGPLPQGTAIMGPAFSIWSERPECSIDLPQLAALLPPSRSYIGSPDIPPEQLDSIHQLTHHTPTTTTTTTTATVQTILPIASRHTASPSKQTISLRFQIFLD